jgi:hypothetical protein
MQSVRLDNSLSLKKGIQFIFGGELGSSNMSYIENHFPGYDDFGDRYRYTTVDSYTVKTTAYAGYASLEISPFERWHLSLGIRRDYTSVNSQHTWEPRLGTSLRLIGNLTLGLRYGYFQQEFPAIMQSRETMLKRLPNLMSHQSILSLQYVPDPETHLTLEIYSKDYLNLPMDTSWPRECMLDDGYSLKFPGAYPSLDTTGRGYAKGLELTIQRKFGHLFSQTIAGSVSSSRYKDLLGIWRPRCFDNRYQLSLISGIDLKSSWNFDLKWTYAGGVPYTPIDAYHSLAYRTQIIDYIHVNSVRYPPYHCLDIQVEKSFSIHQSTLALSIAVINVYNRENVQLYYWDANTQSMEASYQLCFTPLASLRFLF